MAFPLQGGSSEGYLFEIPYTSLCVAIGHPQEQRGHCPCWLRRGILSRRDLEGQVEAPHSYEDSSRYSPSEPKPYSYLLEWIEDSSSLNQFVVNDPHRPSQCDGPRVSLLLLIGRTGWRSLELPLVQDWEGFGRPVGPLQQEDG
jgi:hypothetical protein